jgi:SAM-dependent methyltransferase
MSDASIHTAKSVEKLQPRRRLGDMVRMIAQVTDRPTDEVEVRLLKEKAKPGSAVSEAFAKSDATPHVYDEAMERFYEQTDAFLYELAVWNMSRLKRGMAHDMTRWIQKHIQQPHGRPPRVLSLGDGMGFDTILMAGNGFDTTYFEVPGYTAEFARLNFANQPHDLNFLTDPSKIKSEHYDVVICLDVLEHVPDPPAFVKMLTGYLAPGGVLFTHAPFYMIHWAYPTHVRDSRRFSGSLKPYTDAGLNLIDGAMMWNPLVLQKPGGRAIRPSPLGVAMTRLGQPGLTLGRWTTVPFAIIHRGKKLWQSWYKE